MQPRHQHRQHQQLAQLDPHVERQQRREQVRARELQGLAQGEREPEPVHQPEQERDGPPALHVGAEDVLDRHVHDRRGDERLDQRREPQGVGREVVGRGEQGHRVGDGEGGDDDREGLEPPEGDDQAGEEQQVVGAVEDVLEAHDHEAERGLVPARVKAHDAGVAPQIERPLGPARRQEPQHGDHPQAHPFEARADGEIRPVRPDLIVEQHVEHRLLPDDLRVGGQQRALDVGQRALPGLERAVRRQRDLDGADRRLGQGGVVLEDADLLPHPDHRRVGELVALARPLEVEVARPQGGERHVRQRLQRHPHQEAQALPLGLDERLHGHVAGDVVGRRGGGKPQQERCRRGASDEPPTGRGRPASADCGPGGVRPRAVADGLRRGCGAGESARHGAFAGGR